jgi:polysaccharide biosynthesis/export protein
MTLVACSFLDDTPTSISNITTAPSEPAPYVIGCDDVLDVEVWKQKDLSGPVTVASNGYITMPLVGDVKAVGLTTKQLQKELTTELAGLVHNPNVMVRVDDPKSLVFYVNGEVVHPGVFSLHSGEVLSQAIAEAGGLTPFADPGNIKVVRRSGERGEEIRVNYWLIQSGKDLQGDIPIQRGDTILVP